MSNTLPPDGRSDSPDDPPDDSAPATKPGSTRTPLGPSQAGISQPGTSQAGTGQAGTSTKHTKPSQPVTSSNFKPLRVWPALLLVVAMPAARYLPPLVDDPPLMLVMVAAMGPLIIGGLVLIWWLACSRATALERVVGFLGTLLVAGVAFALSDSSMQGPGTMMLAIPLGTAAFAVGAILFSRRLSFQRTFLALLLSACAFGYSATLRSDGMWGDYGLGLHWRWEPSAEQQMLAQRAARPPVEKPELAAGDLDAWLANPEWPRFRGPDGNGRQSGPRIASDWTAAPPELIWKIPVGPGWSSFAVAGELLFTQEQRGEMETVACYSASSGNEVWTQQIEARFSDPLGGPGPRATPTLAANALYTQGASGHLQRLDPKSGQVVWSQDLREVADREPPMWGFSSSPLAVGSVIITHAGGEGDKGTLAFDAATGNLQWSAAAGDHSYSSPQQGTLAGEPLVLMLTNAGINLLDPQTGSQRLNYTWEYEGYRAVQPQLVDGDSLLLPTATGAGTRRIKVAATSNELAAEEVWTSQRLKPDFNDFVTHDGHAYGFDGSIFTCVELASGKPAWRRGRYGNGQVLLLEESALLLVASETGEIVLLEADPSAHQEVARFQALEGKTWNHPVVVGDRLYLRNAQEAACYRLPLEG